MWRRVCFRSLPNIFRQSLAGWVDDNAPRFGAAFAFYALLSLAPGLVIIVAVAAFAYGHDAARDRLVLHVQAFAGADVAATVQKVVKGASKPSTGFMATMLGVLTLAFGASSAFVELHDALNMIWHVPLRDSTNAATAIRLIKDRLYSFAMVLGSGLLLLVSLLLSTSNAVAGRPIAQMARFTFAFVAIAALFAAVYKNVPDVKLKWGDVALGAAVTSFLFMVGKQLVAIYFARTNAGSVYGTAGSPLVVLLWLYYSALLFFWGAEFTKAYTNILGSHCERPAPT